MEPIRKGLVTAMSVKMKAEITLINEGQLYGLLYSQYLDEPYVFYSFVRMIEKMEEIFDSKKFPQAFMKPRSFNSEKRDTTKRETKGNDVMKDSTMPNVPEGIGGSKSTFEITVKFRQNATWQGQIFWAEKNLRQNFRSVLEMLKLMDEALSEGGQASDTVDWEKST